ncbi:Acetyl-CoA acetyltransferase [Dirofilaria immitis]|nr:Acetyl-CoA acetyltransferase [Dirofilaria immitis]
MLENTSKKKWSTVRTPIGGYRKMLKSCSPVYLGTIATKEAIKRAGISPSDIDETMVGCVLTSCHGQNIARQISINSGIPVTTPCVTINKVCSSSMKAIIFAIQAIHLGDRDVVLAAGTESMSNAYYGVPRNDNNDMSGPFVDSMFEDGLNDAFTKLKMGVCAEKICSEYSISREEQDEYALESYRRAHNAWKVSLLKPAFIPDNGTITAANASTISDGAAALLIASKNFIVRQGCQPIAQVLGYAEAALEPVEFTRAPSVAVKSYCFLRDMGLNSSCVNVRGGAVALGHPIGASGARIVVTLLHALQVNQIGIATICNGGGESTAIAVKRL